MKAQRGLTVAVAVLSVLLVGTIIAIGALLVTRGDNGTSAASDGKVAELETKLTTLESEVASVNAQAAANTQAATTQVSGNNGSSGSSGSSGNSGSGSSGTSSDKAQVEALAVSFAAGEWPTVNWQAGHTIIDGNWASVGVGCPSDHTVQGGIVFLHKVGGSWRIADCGTGLCYGDIPGAPASIFP
jgi:hypothetical protein